MTSENVTEREAVESAAAVSAKAVDDRLIDELVSRAQAEGLQLTGEGGLLQQLTKRLLESALVACSPGLRSRRGIMVIMESDEVDVAIGPRTVVSYRWRSRCSPAGVLPVSCVWRVAVEGLPYWAR